MENFRNEFATTERKKEVKWPESNDERFNLFIKIFCHEETLFGYETLANDVGWTVETSATYEHDF